MNRLRTLHTLLSEGREGQHPVCHDGNRLVLWQEFAHRAEAHAAGFSARTEHRWLLAAERPLDFVVLLLALLHAGKEVLIPPNTQTGTLEQLRSSFDAIADVSISAAPAPLKELDPSSAIIDLYTSGSTGTPKRIRKTLAQLETEIGLLEAQWGHRIEGATIVATAPHAHFYGLLFRLLWPLATGRVFDNLTCAHPDTLLERLALLRDTILVSSPAQLGRLPELIPLTSLQPPPRIIFSSGGPLSANTAREFFHQQGAAPTEIFGSTETGGIAWRRQEDNDHWTPFPGIQVLADENGALCLHSPFLAIDECRPYRMDDAIELQTDGRFRLFGRLDRTVKIEEKRLSLPALEARLAEHPWVDNAAAIALAGRRQFIGAAVILTIDGQNQLLRHGRRATTQELRRHLATHFDAVLLPRHWRFPKQLPLNERGKLTQAAMDQLFSAPPENNSVFQPDLCAVRPGEHPGEITLALHLPTALSHFSGHFPELPLLPGVVQIDWAVRFAREHLNIRGPFSMLENIKFQAVLLPDAHVELTLLWNVEKRRLEFSYANAEKKFSSGRIQFGVDA